MYICSNGAWAARYNTWLLIKLTPKGIVFSFLFSNGCMLHQITICKLSMSHSCCTSFTIVHILHYLGSQTLLLDPASAECMATVTSDERLKVTLKVTKQHRSMQRLECAHISNKTFVQLWISDVPQDRQRALAVAEHDHEAADRKAGPGLRLSRPLRVKQL